MSDLTLSLLAQRLDEQQRENRRWKRATVTVAAVVCAAVLMGQAAPRPTVKTVEAERFILMGRSGKPRAVLTEASDGNVGLRFVDAAETVRLALELQPDGAPWVSVADAAGQRRFMLTVNKDGSPGFSLLNAQERPLVGMSAAPDGTAGLGMTDAAGRARAFVGIRSGGFSLVSVHASDGAIRAALSVLPDGSPSVRIYAADGKVIWKAP